MRSFECWLEKGFAVCCSYYWIAAAEYFSMCHDYFITTRPELARPATTLYQHNLTGILETAVRATNAQFDNPEILKRLDVRLLEVCCTIVTLTWNIPLCVYMQTSWNHIFVNTFPPFLSTEVYFEQYKDHLISHLLFAFPACCLFVFQDVLHPLTAINNTRLSIWGLTEIEADGPDLRFSSANSS